VEVLLDVFVPIHLVDGTLSHHMVPVVEPVMLHIVAQRSHDQSQCIRVVEAGLLLQILVPQN